MEYDKYLIDLATDWCDKYGVSVKNKDDEFRDFIEIIKELSKKIHEYEHEND